MVGTIKLTRFTSDPSQDAVFSRHNWPLIIHAKGTGDMPSELFVFQRTTSSIDPSQYDQFSCVASAHDVFELGVNPGWDPDSETGTPFYRSSVLRLFLRSPEDLEEVWLKIKEDAVALVRNLEAENRMKAVDSTEITATDTSPVTTTEVVESFENVDQVLLQLDYRPSGIADVGVDDNQTILSPDDSLKGWLPVSEAGLDTDVPVGAKFFYNLPQDSAVLDELPFLEPGNVHMLFYNGRKLTHGDTYTINRTGIFWMSDISSIDGEIILSSGNPGEAPWPLDYVDRGSPGSTTPTIELLLFRE